MTTSSNDQQQQSNQPNYFCVKNLKVSFANKCIVNDLNLSLSKGEIGCLLGFSGCGKTTALRAIAGLEHTDAGHIQLDNDVLTDTTHLVDPSKRNMGMVFQDYALFAHISVADNIGFGLQHMSKQQKQQRIHEMLELVELTEHANKKPNQLSGGQQQRVALARALAPEPKLLLLDEPFSNLDVVLRETLARNVRQILKCTDTTAILVTHDQNEAFAIADKIGVMSGGNIVQWDTPSGLYHRPQTPMVASFIGEGTMVTGKMSKGIAKTALGDVYQVHAEDSGQHDSDLPDDTKVKVLVRPDDIVHDDHSDMTVKVIDRVFRGSHYLYHLQLPDGQTILSLTSSHHEHDIGSDIGIKVNLEHQVVFADVEEVN